MGPAAALMYQETCAWRASYGIQELMSTHGTGELYGADGSRTGDPTSWQWCRTARTQHAEVAARYGFFGRLRTCAPDGGPVAIWRVPDLGGIKREGLASLLQDAFVAHIEDLLQ